MPLSYSLSLCLTSEDGGLDEVTLVTMAVATHVAGSTLLLALGNVVHDTVKLDLGDLGALVGGLVERITDLGGSRELLEAGKELVVDALLDVDTRTSAAALTVVEEDTLVGPLDGLVEVGIVKDDVGRLATELEGDLLEVALGSGLHDHTTDGSAAGEGNLADLGVAGEGITSNGTVASDDVDNTWGEASLDDELGDLEGRERGHLRGLDDNGVTRAEGGAELPAKHHEREVPGDDGTADTDGLVTGVRELALSLNDLAVELVSPARKVAEGLGDLGSVKVARESDTLAVVEGLDLGELLNVGLDQVGELVHADSTVTRAGLTPGTLAVGLLGGVDGLVDLLDLGCRNTRTHANESDGRADLSSFICLPAWTSQIFSPVAGLTVSRVLPPATNSLLMNRPVFTRKEGETQTRTRESTQKD